MLIVFILCVWCELAALLSDELRKCGIRTYVENVLDGNKLDDVIQKDGHKALSAVNKMGTKLALEMIKKGEEGDDPEIVLRAMREHPRKRNVHEAALDVLWEMAKTENQIAEIIAYDGHIVVTDTIRRFVTHASIQTKGFGAVSCLSKNATACSLLGKQDAVKLAVLAYHKFDNNFQVQQQVLWALDALAILPNNKERMDRDGFKVIIRTLAKEAKSRTDAKIKRGEEPHMAWRLVPVRLKTLWTRAELVEDYKPMKPGDDQEAEGDGEAHYDVSVKEHTGNYKEVKWQEIDLYPK